MRAFLHAALALLTLVAPAHAAWRTETFTLKGAHGLVIIPDGWDPATGSLFIYAHGYSADSRILTPFPADLTPETFLTKVNLLYAASLVPATLGHASAVTTYRSVGWYVKDAVKDIENLRRRFVKTHGRPKHTYLWGHSGGGMVTSTVIEYFPRTYDGAMPLCGTAAGGRRNFNGAFDLRVLFEWVCRDVAEARFTCRVCSDGRHRCLWDGDCPAGQTCGGAEAAPPPEDGLTAPCSDFLLDHPDRFSETPTSVGGGFVAGPARACFGDGASATPEQRARRDLFLRASQLPAGFVETDLFFASIGMAEVVHRRTGGRHPWGNAGVEYASPLLTAGEQAALNAEVHRAREDARAAAYLRRWYEPRGRTESKVLTVHALDDGLVLPENEDKYRQAFLASGRADQLVQLFTTAGGHCEFIAELFPAFQALTTWVERGERPSLASVQAACPTCTFTATTPGPLGLKVPERRQRGVPLASLVCDGQPGDCPPGSSCSLARHRCR